MSEFNLDDSPILLRQDNMIYTVLTPRFETQAYDIVSDSFADEPAGIHCETNREIRVPQWRQFAGFFSKECASNGNSIVCIDSTNGNVAGVFWVRDFMNDLPDGFTVDDLPCIAPVVGVLVSLDDSYHAMRPDLKRGECVDLWMLGVSPNYRRRGIAANLTTIARDWVSNMGYKYICLEASGGFSAKCAEKAGFRSVVTKVYVEENPIFEGMPLEHQKMQFFELELPNKTE